eukprot:TRINITY_DN28955_c0_g1_i2.p1 TRINITY_DN28955_c0_g1~~TRINITY_DN28955_c0_g1_i2.p1  ORF type:complete len:626 (-),score=84.93 TRINITY_DN28955_c0_g1_i2:23-1849(-)
MAQLSLPSPKPVQAGLRWTPKVLRPSPAAESCQSSLAETASAATKTRQLSESTCCFRPGLAQKAVAVHLLLRSLQRPSRRLRRAAAIVDCEVEDLDAQADALGIDEVARQALAKLPQSQACEVLASCREAIGELRNPSAFVMRQVRLRDVLPEPPSEGSILEVRVSKLLSHGQGVAVVGSSEWVIMVMFALPGELVEVRIQRNFKRYSEAKLLKVLEPSPDRVEPKCPLYGKCSGCQYQHVSYEAQLGWKQQHTLGTLNKISGVELPESLLEEIVASPLQYNYRTKLTPKLEAIARSDGDPECRDIRNGAPIGICSQEWGDHRDTLGRRWRRVIDVETCPLATAAINEALPGARAVLRARAAKLFEELPAAGRRIESRKKRGPLVALLRHTEFDGVVCDRWDQVVTERIGELGTFCFYAGHFFQVNTSILPAFVREVIAAASAAWVLPNAREQSARPRFLVDVFCGVGLFAVAGRAHFEKSFGIELDKKAVGLAHQNVKANSASNVTFLALDAELGLRQVRAEASPEESAVIVDPPREGLKDGACELLAAWRPRRLVYISCDPATQGRDLKRLCAAGYVVRRVRPFDLFPQTRHIESMVVLELPAKQI